MKYEEIREQCEAAGAVMDEGGVPVCGFNHGVKCCGFSCPSKRYWNSGRVEIGKHKIKAIAHVRDTQEA